MRSWFKRRPASPAETAQPDEAPPSNASSAEPPGPSPLPRQPRGSPFWEYNCLIDAEGTIERHTRRDLSPQPGYLTNFVGIKMSPRYVHGAIDGREGQIEDPPLPASWHADLAEWAAALRAVDLAGQHFRMAEMGCGWGCWMSNTGAAARHLGKSVHLIGVEGDEDHVAYAHEHMPFNGFSVDEYEIVRGIAAPSSGIALFPRQEISGKEYGSEPVFGVTEQERDQAIVAGSHDALDMIPPSALVRNDQPLDLMHIDIQGGEAGFVKGALPELDRHVAYLVIGTHSRELEGHLFETLRGAGWRLEIERPAFLHLDPHRGPVIKIDGVQGWRNMRLRPD